MEFGKEARNENLNAHAPDFVRVLPPDVLLPTLSEFLKGEDSASKKRLLEAINYSLVVFVTSRKTDRVEGGCSFLHFLAFIS